LILKPHPVPSLPPIRRTGAGEGERSPSFEEGGRGEGERSPAFEEGGKGEGERSPSFEEGGKGEVSKIYENFNFFNYIFPVCRRCGGCC